MKLTAQATDAIVWIKELQISTAKQRKGRLGDEDNGFCCLGLGCNVLKLKYSPMASFSATFKEAVGLYNAHGEPTTGNPDTEYSNTLVILNDEAGKTFAEIASILLANPDNYFEPETAKQIKEYFANEENN